MSGEGRAAPLISIITPVYNTPLDVLSECLDSVLAQTFDDWELVLVDDCSPDERVRATLRQYAARDPRVVVVERETNGHIVAASNDGIAAARGTFLAMLDHDDQLVPTALERVSQVIAEHDDLDYLYTDEDKIDARGKRFAAFHKPDWSPERMRGHMYTCHLSVFRASLVREVGGFRDGFDGSQDYDLVLRVTEQARRIEHVREVLYHWRIVPGSTAGDSQAKPYAYLAALRAVQEQLDRLGIDGTVSLGRAPGTYTISRRLPAERRVSLIIPTIGQSGLVWGRRRTFVVDAVRSMLEKTNHSNLEVVVVYDPPTPPEVLQQLRELVGERLVLVPFDRPFSHSEKMNLGVLHSTGDRLVLLNDDLEVISENWLEELVAPLEEAGVGMTGAKLYFADTTVQHAGHRYADQAYGHWLFRALRDDKGPFNALVLSREASGVTAACAGISRETFFEIGGFSEQLPTNYNDVDLSYKVRSLDLRIVWLATVELYHFESVSRGKQDVPEETKQFCRRRWGRVDDDPYAPRYSPKAAGGTVVLTKEDIATLRQQLARLEGGLAPSAGGKRP